MNKPSKFFLIVLFLQLIAILSLFLIDLFFMPERNILSDFKTAWHLYQAVIRYYSMYPQILFASLFFCFGISGIKKNTKHWTRREVQASVLFIFALGVTYLFFLGYILPGTHTKKSKIEYLSNEFKEHITITQDAIKKEDWEEAKNHINVCREIAQKNKEYLKFNGIIELRSPVKEAEPEEEITISRHKTGNSETKTANSYYLEALQAYDNGDYYTAHSFATLSSRIDSTRNDAQQLASRSWEKITNAEEGIQDKKQREIAYKKRTAYKLLESGQVIQAYESFLALKSENQNDLDITRYLEESYEKVKSITFFRDELNQLINYQMVNNIAFQYEINDEQIFLATKNIRFDNNIFYFFDLEMLSVKHNKEQFHIKTQYAKLGLRQLLLSSYDQKKSDGYSLPYSVGISSLQSINNVVNFPFNSQDMKKICLGFMNVKNLSLYDLLILSISNHKYGINTTNCVEEIYYILSDFFGILLFLTIIVAFGLKNVIPTSPMGIIELLLSIFLSFYLFTTVFTLWRWLAVFFLRNFRGYANFLPVIIILCIECFLTLCSSLFIITYRPEENISA